MPSRRVPRRPEDIDPDWLQAVVSTAVGRRVALGPIRVDVIGHGFLGTVARIAIDSDDADLPSSLVVKLGHPDPATRAQVWDAGIYQIEARFYRELAPRIPLTTPRCWHVTSDPALDLHAIVIDDLSGAELHDQLDGCPPDRAYAIVEDLATLHRAVWGEPDRLAPALTRAAEDTAWFELTAGSVPAMLERDDLSADLRWLTERYEVLGPRVAGLLNRQPTIVHADARIENVFFHPDGTRTWIDWDGIQIGGGAADLAYFLSQSLTVDVRRANERSLLEHYLEALGRPDVTMDDLVADYRRGIVAGWAVGLVAVGVYGARDDRAGRLLAEGIRRVGAAVADTDALEELR